ncbi:MAG TPA: HAD family acid phosphatase [Bryobacteraceae bacterium]|jgi:predicted secreted acid phosphatase
MKFESVGLRLLGIILVAPMLAPAQVAESQAPPVAATLPNLADVINQLVRYHDTGQYDFEIRQVVEAARSYADTRVKAAGKDERLAAVFDIDETALSNYEVMADCGFCSGRAQSRLYSNVKAQAIPPVLDLFNFVKSKGVKVFFVTGRSDTQRENTARNLKEVGYLDYEDLLMRPAGNTEPARLMKPVRRQSIVDKGYTIILNIGDQASDLAGCCAERTFKLPNPFYLVP